MKDYINSENQININQQILSILNEIARHIATAEMNGFVISDSNKNIIGTVGLAVCDGIIFYDRKNKWGIVGHAVGDKKIALLSDMLKNLPSDKDIVIEYAIVTGYDNIRNGNYTDTNKMLEYLKNNCPENIKLIPFQTDLGIRVGQSYGNEFYFDVKSGKTASQILNYYDYLDFSFSNDNLNNKGISK